MKKSSKMNWININKVSGLLLYCAYFDWKRKIKTMLLIHDLTHFHCMLLMTLGFLQKDGADL